MNSREQVDAVVVGSRCAGSASAIALALGGRRVIAVDRTAFPSDTLSTHVNFPSAVAELARVGALARVRRCDPPECRIARIEADGVICRNRFEPVDGIDYGQCVPRTILDQALVETAREAGVEVRERTGLVDLRWSGGRVSGVRVRESGGREYELDCQLVIGADGRRSTTASLVGAERPYRGSRNGRGAAFWYGDDPHMGTEWRDTLVQFRQRETHTFVFPCPDGRLLVLFMGPVDDVPRFRRDPEGGWARMMYENPRVAERVGASTNRTKMRSTADIAAFFRRSTGPGWALCGDAGHFKDPVIGQGIRDALRFGRLLGEAAAPAIEDPARLDRALAAVEHRRDRECMASYHWGNRESRIFLPSPLIKEALRAFDGAEPPLLSQMFDRRRAPHAILNPLRGARLAARAALRPGVDRRALAREVAEELRIDLDIYREQLSRRFRYARPSASERPLEGGPGVPSPAVAVPETPPAPAVTA